MRIETYDPESMEIIESDATQVDFGTVARGHYNSQAVVVRPVAVSETFSRLAMFLEDNDGLNHTRFDKFKSAVPILGVEPGDPLFSDYFTQAFGVSDFTNFENISDYGIVFDHTSPEYVWMDAMVGTSENNLGDAVVNFRFIFEYV